MILNASENISQNKLWNMSTKMVLRKQTGHICPDCKMSFKAKELLLEHNESCLAIKGMFKPIDTKVKLPGLDTNACQISSELGTLLVGDSIYVSQVQITNAKNIKSNEVVENVCFPIQYGDVISNNDINKTIELTEDVIVKSNSVGALGTIMSDNSAVIQDQSGEQIVASLVDVTNVENLFDNDVCAFEVIEETVENESFSHADNKHSQNAIYLSDCMKKLHKKRRLNSGSSGICEAGNNSSNNSSNSSCNNPSVYSLCLAAELASTMETAHAAKLASSMETVQAAKSLLGMSLQQGEVETDDSGNIKMVSILRKKSELVPQMSTHDMMISTQNSIGIKREIGDHIRPDSSPTLNVNSKISFLQSLNKRIIGKDTDGVAFSDLITTPVTCDPKVKVEIDGDELFIPEKKLSKMNFNVLKSNNTNTTSVGAKVMGEKSRNIIPAQNITRPVYPLHHQSNVLKNRQSLLPAFITHDAALMPVTNEVEVIAEIEKSDAKPFNSNFQGRQYVIHVPSNFTAATHLSPVVNEMDEVKGSNLYVCGICNKSFDDCETLKLHVEKHIGLERQNSNKMKNPEDRSDDESIGDDEDVQKILGTKHECRECGLQFARFSILKRHAKIEHGGLKAYVCGACNKTFPFACGLKLHAHTHGAERRYSCQYCGRRFKHASNLQKHVKVVHINACKCRTVDCTCGKRDLSSFKIDHACRICGRVCESSKHLEIHHRSHTGEKPEVCQTCGKSFQHKSNLQKHQLKHTGIRPYKCSHCDRSFFVKHSYLGHMRLHTRDSPYTCETCGKSFISKNGLQVHSILHQDHLPFRCGQCGREFAQLGNLNKHLSLHTGDKPFPCKTCDKKFVDTSALKRHMVIHTRERNYSCPECGKTFLHFSSLRSHMTTHKFEERERHQCSICNKIFTVKSNYIRHMKQHEEGPSSESEQIEYLVYMQ